MRERIVVVGAGIGGLSIANGLKKLGYKVSVLEAAKEYSEVNTGLRLWSFGVAGLVELGISLDDLKVAGLPNYCLKTKTKKGKVLNTMDTSEVNRIAKYPNYEVHRSRLQQVLGDSLGEEQIKFNHKLSKIESGQQTDGEITIHCQNDVTITADYVIGADGLWSKVRNFINPELACLHRFLECFFFANKSAATWGYKEG